MANKLCLVMLNNYSRKQVLSWVLLTRIRTYSNEANLLRQVHVKESFITKKFSEIVQWYENVTGMDEVRLAQNRVLEAEQKFITAQERRREANKMVSSIQNTLKDLYAELDNTTRGEERYVQLITQEHKVLKEEKQLREEFQRYESEERDYFTTLSSAVKESHEKERAQAERTKYWSIIGSIIGTVIGIVGSSINNELKMKELRKLVRESITRPGDLSTSVPEVLSRHEKELSGIVNEMKNVSSVPSEHVLARLTELIHTIDNKVNVQKHAVTNGDRDIIDALKQQEIFLDKKFEELKSTITSQRTAVTQLSDQQVLVMPFGLEDRIESHYRYTRNSVLCSTVVLAVLIPLLYKVSGLS